MLQPDIVRKYINKMFFASSAPACTPSKSHDPEIIDNSVLFNEHICPIYPFK